MTRHGPGARPRPRRGRWAGRRSEGRVAVLKRLLLILAGLALAGLGALAALGPAGDRDRVHPPEIDDGSRARLLDMLEGSEGADPRGGSR